jgi:hypothetical protein
MKMASSGRDDWKLLSILLIFGLAVSLMINVLSALPRQGTEVAPQSEFVFSWDASTQRIVNGTFFLTLKMWLYGQNLTVVATANDDEYDWFDYLGLVFDSNKNGHIDMGDQAIGLWASNYTVESNLEEFGLLSFFQAIPVRGPQDVTFDVSKGYTFTVHFPFYYPTRLDTPWFNPGASLVSGMNQVHACFYDDNASYTSRGQAGVFSRFSFELTK